MNIMNNKYVSLFLMPALSGILIALSFPNFNLSFLAWVGLVPLLFSTRKTDTKTSLMSGFITGFTANAVIMYWIYPMIKFNTDSHLQAAVCLATLSAYLAIYYGIWAALFLYGEKSGSLLRFSLFASVIWVVLEYLRTYFLTGFPWCLLGMSQWRFITLIQLCEFTGIYGISFILVLVNVMLARFIETKKLPSLIITVALVACIITGAYVIKLRNQVSSPPYITAAVLQGNIDQYKKWDGNYKDEILKKYSSLAREASKQHPDIIIWPETAVPGYLPSDPLLYSTISSIVRETGTYNLIGTPYNNSDNLVYNAVCLFGPEGELLAWHKKTHLVPFGEFVPFRKVFEPFFGVLNTLGDFSRGSDHSAFAVKSVRWGPTICSENFFGGIVRQVVNNGAEIIVNQTNDAWFFNTSAPKQHFIMNVFRAIENRRTVIVSGNTGISGVVNPSGVITQMTNTFTTEYFVTKVSPSKRITFYTHWGDVFAKLCVLTAFLFFMMMFIDFNFCS